MKDIYIVDIRSANKNGRSEGHYFAVAENYINVFSSVADVYVAGGPIYKKKFDRYFALPFDSIGNSIRDKITTIINAIYALKRIRNQTLVFQCSAISTVCLIIALFSTTNDIYLIQYDTCMIASKWRKLIFNRTRKRIKGIICPGKEIGVALETEYCVVPDYIYCSRELVTKNSEFQYDFGMYGILAQGKGILEAVELLAKSNYRVKIAGKVAGLPEDKVMMEKLQEIAAIHPNIMLEIGYLPDEKYKEYITSTKYVILNYSDSYALRSSGVILDAIYNYTPVIVRRRKYADFVGDSEIGVVYDHLGEVDLEQLLHDNVRSNFIENIDKYLKMQEKHRHTLTEFVLGK